MQDSAQFLLRIDAYPDSEDACFSWLGLNTEMLQSRPGDFGCPWNNILYSESPQGSRYFYLHVPKTEPLLPSFPSQLNAWTPHVSTMWGQPPPAVHSIEARPLLRHRCQTEIVSDLTKNIARQTIHRRQEISHAKNHSLPLVRQ